MLFCGFGASSFVLGTVIAYAAERRPRRKAKMELCGGFLIIGGIAVLGYGLGHAVGRP
jgi:VIT1/CCC1 family predicted Fe2+/Mn2+ transporter